MGVGLIILGTFKLLGYDRFKWNEYFVYKVDFKILNKYLENYIGINYAYTSICSSYASVMFYLYFTTRN